MTGPAALLWDVDGTLAETERDGHRVAFNGAFEALGVPWRWDAERYGALLAVAGGRERLLHDMAARAAATPAGESSMASARAATRPRPCSAAWYTAGSGFFRATSSPQTITPNHAGHAAPRWPSSSAATLARLVVVAMPRPRPCVRHSSSSSRTPARSGTRPPPTSSA